MKKLLISVHTPSKNTQALAEKAKQGVIKAKADILLIYKTPLQTTPEDVLQADGIILGTTENIGYMAGLTKDFFDRCYYPALEKKQGLPVALYIRAGLDGTGTQKAIEKIMLGLRWQLIQAPLICKGAWQTSFLTAVEELAMTMAVGLEAGIY